MSYFELLQLVSPEATLTVTALLLLALGLTTQKRVERGAAASICTLVAGLGILLSIFAVLRLPPNLVRYNGMLVISPLTSLFEIICLTLAFFAVLLSRDEESLARNRGEFLAIFLLATIGLLLLVSSEELLMIFIGLELTGLSLYLMTAFDKSDIRSAEAGLKYFLFGSTASAFTLFGLSLLYGMSGSTSLAIIAQNLSSIPVQPLLAAGIVMTLVGLAFKVAAAPFHLWAPDAYQAAPITSAAFIASGSKVAAFFVLGKIVLIGFGPLAGSAAWHAMVSGWVPLLAALAALSILIGNFVALAQTNLRRLLAYSAVAHAGYTLLGLVAADRNGFAATLFYTSIYAFTLVGAFGVVAAVRRATGGDNLSDFAGLSSRSPFLAGCMSIFLLSLAGLPPLAGFFGKFYLFSAAFRSGTQHGLVWLIALALFGSLVSLYYYLMVLKIIFAGQSPVARPTMGLNLVQNLSLSALALVVLLLGVVPGPFVTRIISALPSWQR